MVLSIFILYVCYVIVAYAESLLILRLLEDTGSLSQVHDCLGIFLLQEVVDLESSCVQKFLEKFL